MDMGFLDSIFGNKSSDSSSGVVPYGEQKKDGTHDHRYNTGNDRTPAQKKGDKSKGGK
jgi:hypothetical protein